VQFILSPTPKTLYEAEQQGFLRLARGYSQAQSLDEMVRVTHWITSLLFSPPPQISFLNASHQEDDFSHVTQRSIDVESNQDPTARLHERESILIAIHTADRLSAFVHSILSSIHAISFSYEWNELSCKPGGKRWKTQYRIRAFEKFNPDFQSYSLADYNKKLKTFTSRHEKVIKARNNLRKLFVTVGPSLPCIYYLLTSAPPVPCRRSPRPNLDAYRLLHHRNNRSLHILSSHPRLFSFQHRHPS
jgi:hypothetical protein